MRINSGVVAVGVAGQTMMLSAKSLTGRDSATDAIRTCKWNLEGDHLSDPLTI